MVNKKFWLGILAAALVFTMTVVGCDNGSTSGSGKSITISGITGKTGNVVIYVLNGFDDDGLLIAAMGIGSISGNSVKFNLVKDDDSNPFTGSGSYYLMLGFESDESEYTYTNGQTLEQLGITDDESIMSKLPKYDISSSSSTIAFSKFIESTEW